MSSGPSNAKFSAEEVAAFVQAAYPHIDAGGTLPGYPASRNDNHAKWMELFGDDNGMSPSFMYGVLRGRLRTEVTGPLFEERPIADNSFESRPFQKRGQKAELVIPDNAEEIAARYGLKLKKKR